MNAPATPPASLPPTRRARLLAPLPPFLVGASAAIAGEVALGLLLYAAEGLMRSLTTVLVAEAAALGLGMAGAPAAGPGLTEQLRRRWLMCLVSFAAAAVFATSWSAVDTLGSGPLSRGLGLAVLAALPLYTCGGVLGGLGAALHDVSPGVTGTAGALGAAAGFLTVGVLLPRSPLPASLLLGAMVLLSLGGLAFGAVHGARRIDEEPVPDVDEPVPDVSSEDPAT